MLLTPLVYSPLLHPQRHYTTLVTPWLVPPAPTLRHIAQLQSHSLNKAYLAPSPSDFYSSHDTVALLRYIIPSDSILWRT
jgi:hypothetical protein